MNFFKELQRRNVIKAGLAYLVTSWIILQIASLLFPILQIDIKFQKWLLIALLIGFPLWIIFAYIYDWTPEGFKKTADEDEAITTGLPSKNISTRYIILGLSIALVLLIADKVFNIALGEDIKSSEIKTIAVLPFQHDSETNEDEFFTRGVHEDIMTKLAGVKDFRIIAKSTIMPLKDFEGDLKKLGEELKAQYFLEGTVRKWKDDIRMTVQLIESSTNQAIWSHEYSGKLTNVLELQATIANVITQKLKANLSKKEKKDIGEFPTSIVSAYEDFLKARDILNNPRKTNQEINQAVLLLKKSVEADPNFTNAWSLLVEAYSEEYRNLSRLDGNEEEMAKAKENAQLALNTAKQLAPNQWEVLAEEGFYLLNIEKDKIAALKAFEKAVEQNPSDLASMRELAFIYLTLADLEKGTSILENAFTVAPNNGLISYGLTFMYEFQGAYDKMVPLMERLFEIFPEEKHYLVEAKYYKFLKDGSLSSYKEFENIVKETNAENPWDERALKNMDMIVAMFNNEFEQYHEDWKGKNNNHIKDHGDWMCPLVANDYINQARVLITHDENEDANEIMEEVSEIVLRPVNPNSICVFNPDVYLPKLDFLRGEKSVAKEKIEALVLPTLQNKNFPTGAVERSVLLQAMDLIEPERVYYFYEQIVKNTLSMTSFESICADPWTYPNLLKDPRFISEVKADGRFVDFLKTYNFL
ncbi:hypothetical protein [Aegicerativicinus sediminis]|uniref:hypothetical protein n=1 Tax=Aegicerativicinus sediminis TaxID=2893202 RepID=UPI001E2A79F9|nr:hypothetical protein [Aegicerativicinus sediminis]